MPKKACFESKPHYSPCLLMYENTSIKYNININALSLIILVFSDFSLYSFPPFEDVFSVAWVRRCWPCRCDLSFRQGENRLTDSGIVVGDMLVQNLEHKKEKDCDKHFVYHNFVVMLTAISGRMFILVRLFSLPDHVMCLVMRNEGCQNDTCGVMSSFLQLIAAGTEYPCTWWLSEYRKSLSIYWSNKGLKISLSDQWKNLHPYHVVFNWWGISTYYLTKWKDGDII